MLSFYRKFLPNLAEVVKPLTDMTSKNVPFRWSNEAEGAFWESKSLLKASDLLVHFDLNREVILTCDASRLGVAAVLGQVDDEGHERPVQCASRALSKAEMGYTHRYRGKHWPLYGVWKSSITSCMDASFG